jgi:peptide/nickel transport system substrate-binding protein
VLAPAYDAAGASSVLQQVASPRILELLLQLERAGETPTARAILLQIDRESRNELPVIPLWEMVEHLARRGRLTGMRESPRSLYDDVASWRLAPR